MSPSRSFGFVLLSGPAASQLLKEFFVECLVFLLRPHRQEDVATDELVDHLTRNAHAGERDLLLLEVEDDVVHLPVDVPGLQRVVAPRLDRVPSVHVHSDDAVTRNAHQLLTSNK